VAHQKKETVLPKKVYSSFANLAGLRIAPQTLRPSFLGEAERVEGTILFSISFLLRFTKAVKGYTILFIH